MIYAYVTMNISNQTSLAAYKEKAGDALSKHSGSVVAMARETTVLEGRIEQHDVTAILSFPDKAAALAWRQDPELAQTHALREGSGDTAILLLG